MTTALVVGSGSDIARGLMPLMKADGWSILQWQRGMLLPNDFHWDLFLCCLGSVAPVGLWNEVGLVRRVGGQQPPGQRETDSVRECFESNLFLPYEILKMMWPSRNPGASVCFLAGSNPNTIMKGYFAYNVSKMALLKAVEQMDAETPDAKFFALGPGTILTKIHQATIDARWDNPKLKAVREQGQNPQEKIELVYECLKWCMAQPKEVIGGRNICVSDHWDEPLGGITLESDLLGDPDLFKLRRYET